MKKTILAATLSLSLTPLSAFAVAPGGPNCGWGNMLFEGEKGLGIHLIASLVNGRPSGELVRMTLGTNGCSTDGALTYNGQNLLQASEFMDDNAHDIALGEGEALDALALLVGIAPEDRSTFAQVTHENFQTIFPSPDATTEEVLKAIGEVMKTNEQLAKYVS
mgnify:CR=1 FL=1